MSFKQELLNFISDAGVFIPRIEFPYDYLRRIRKATYYGTLRRLEQDKLIVREKTRKGISYRITDNGRLLLKKPIVPKKRKDGFSTIVIFDIPEHKRKARNALRKFLLKNGFRSLQKSVYMSRNKTPGSIIELTRELDLVSNVSVIGGKIEYYL